MDNPKFPDFGAFFRAEIMPKMIASVEPALDHLRRTNPKEWLRVAMQLQKRGPYDRVEQTKEATDAFIELIKLLASGLTESVPVFVKRNNEAMEKHFVRHGLELDDLLRRNPDEKPMSTSESVEAQMRAWGVTFKVNPDDKR